MRLKKSIGTLSSCYRTKAITMKMVRPSMENDFCFILFFDSLNEKMIVTYFTEMLHHMSHCDFL